MESNDMIFCLMPTYNRYPDSGWMVDEAVECFLRQDYPYRHLLIWNDTPDQYLAFEHPQVTIVNSLGRFPCISSKVRAMIKVLLDDYGTERDPLFCRWDDDDIHLPHRLSYSLGRLGTHAEWRPHNYVYSNAGVLHEVHPGNGHPRALWRASVLKTIGGYPNMPGGEDQHFSTLIDKHGLGLAEAIPCADHFYIYRWGTGSFHLSGGADLVAQWNKCGKQPIKQGTFHINPHWKEDYVKLVSEVCNE